MKEIQLTQGYKAQVSDKDYKRVMALGKWQAYVMYRADGSIRALYAMHSYNNRTQFLHRFILGITDSKVFVDHKDRNGLNNQRKNLRKATQAQNYHNARLSVKNTSGFKGVSPVKGNRKKPWRVDIAYGGKQYFLGYFQTAEEAAVVRKAAAKKHHKTFAN